jgi:hypothetical protein
MIPVETITEFAKVEGLTAFQVSAKNGDGITECFLDIVKSSNFQEASVEEDGTIEMSQEFYKQYEQLRNAKEKKVLSCCYI